MPDRRRGTLGSAPELASGSPPGAGRPRGAAALTATLSLLALACVPNGATTTDASAATGGHVGPASGGAPGTPSGGAPGTSSGGSTASGGNPGGNSGGAPGTGGSAASGGAPAASGGSSGAGGAGGRAATGGGAGTGGRGGGAGGAGTGGRPGGSGSGGAANKVYSQCRFHFGTIDSIAKSNSSMIPQLDFFTPGWMGQSDTFNMKSVCDEAKAQFASQVPVIVSYTAAFFAKRHNNLKDCNAGGAQQDLCVAGAAVIQQNLSTIVGIYENYAQGFAGCYGTTKPIIFLMEPDFYQYTASSQSQPWSPALAGQIMGQFVNAMKKHLPNALFSLDISPWVAPNNGSDHGATWFSNFDMSLFTFINTSGGGTDASSAKIRAANMMTWAGVSAATGKAIMADTGYGVNGASAGPDPAWDNVTNINARIDDGVVSISQYNPASNWGSTISGIRAQIKAPRFCP